jgi:hypothetical protein
VPGVGGEEYRSFGVRHESEDTSSECLNTCETTGRSVGVVRVSFRWSTRGIDVANSDRRSGTFESRGREECCTTFTVSDSDGERRADHLAKEDRRLSGGRIDNFDLSESSFESTRQVLLEERPVLGSGNEVS